MPLINALVKLIVFPENLKNYTECRYVYEKSGAVDTSPPSTTKIHRYSPFALAKRIYSSRLVNCQRLRLRGWS